MDSCWEVQRGHPRSSARASSIWGTTDSYFTPTRPRHTGQEFQAWPLGEKSVRYKQHDTSSIVHQPRQQQEAKGQSRAPSQDPVALSIPWHWFCSLCHLWEFLNLLPMMEMLPPKRIQHKHILHPRISSHYHWLHFSFLSVWYVHNVYSWTMEFPPQFVYTVFSSPFQ